MKVIQTEHSLHIEICLWDKVYQSSEPPSGLDPQALVCLI